VAPYRPSRSFPSFESAGRAWSLALYEHPERPDGILYPSRLNDQTNIAVYNRAIAKLEVASKVPLLAAPGLADILDTYRVAIV